MNAPYDTTLRPAIVQYIMKRSREGAPYTHVDELLRNVPEAKGDRYRVRCAVGNAKQAGEISRGPRWGTYQPLMPQEPAGTDSHEVELLRLRIQYLEAALEDQLRSGRLRHKMLVKTIKSFQKLAVKPLGEIL
jgi:hypothetical protein